MKKILLTMVLALVTVCSWADRYEVMIDGIYYDLIDEGSFYDENLGFNFAIVTRPFGFRYTDYNIEIPSTVEYDGVSYTIIRIYDSAFSYSKNLGSVTIPNTVTKIGAYAFSNCTELSNITILNPETEIHPSAFKNCISLPEYEGCRYVGNFLVGRVDYGQTEYVIKDGTTVIGEEAFSNCSQLTTIRIPNTVKHIGDNAFKNCTNLPVYEGCRYADNFLVEAVDKGKKEYKIKEGTTYIGDYAFQNCGSLSSIIIPNSVKRIGSYAFASCSNLTSVTLSDSLTIIDSNAFTSCSSLTSINIPKSVTHIGSDAFDGCEGISKVNISDLTGWCNIEFGSDSNPTKYSHNLYLNGKEITDLDIPDNVTKISDCAFEYCHSITSVNMPNSVTSIGSFAFRDCKNLSSVNLSDSLTRIDNSAFTGCSSITSINIPNNVTSIGISAFKNCIYEA